MSEFKEFNKIGRWNREVIVTEKIDGTNSCIVIEDGQLKHCQSRNRIITPDDDNYGFAKWVNDNKDFLVNLLGDGYHYGEWWGQGIQRRYGMDRKIFSLFNAKRWESLKDYDKAQEIGLSVVPILFKGNMEDMNVSDIMSELKKGSIAGNGYNNPEGIIIFHTSNGALFKKTFEYDEKGKGDNR